MKLCGTHLSHRGHIDLHELAYNETDCQTGANGQLDKFLIIFMS